MFRPGFLTQADASDLNRLVAEVVALRQDLDRRVRQNVPETRLAKLTARDGDGRYSWTEQYVKSDGTLADVPTNPTVGTPAYNPAVELNGASVVLPYYVRLRQQLNSLDRGPLWEFEAAEEMEAVKCTSTTRAVSRTGNTTNASAVVTLASTDGLSEDESFYGPGIPAGTTIASIDSETQITLSAAATATASGVTFRMGEYYPASIQDFAASPATWSAASSVYLLDINAAAGDNCPFTLDRRYLAKFFDTHADGTPIYGLELYGNILC